MKPIYSTSYSVYFEDSLRQLRTFLNERKYSKIFVLADSNTEKFCLPLAKKTKISISASEYGGCS
jgi:3-dehydroquinate synthase